jgi:3-oxoacyl-[acyl-carrier protein] reductase
MVDANLDFSGKVVAVVGGSSGIGNAIARAFRDRSATVHVTGTRSGSAEYSKGGDSDLDGMTYHQLDVADTMAIARFCATFEALDVLVQSQGMVVYGRKEFEVETFTKVLDINLTSLMACSSGMFDQLKASGGTVIIISSTAAFHATVGNPAYNASKAGAAGLTRTLGKAWAHEGIRVNGIAPGLIETKMTAVTTQHEGRRASVLANIPVGRIGAPDDMAGLALFLASPMASYIVGQTIIADGGMLL